MKFVVQAEQLTQLTALNVSEENFLEPRVQADARRMVCAGGGCMLYSSMDIPCSAGFQSTLASDVVEIKRREIG
jgi:hypothetical protein